MNLDRPILIIGAGGHAKVVASTLKRLDAEVMGLVDADPARHGQRVLGFLVLGGDEWVMGRDPNSLHLVNGIGSVGRPGLRRDLFLRLKAKGFQFASLVDPTAIVAEEVALDEGAQVLAGAVLQPGTRLGANVIVNTRASVDHDCLIGAHVHIAPGAVLSGSVAVGDFVHIGTGASIKQGVRIGSGAVVGIGAAVTRDVAPDTTVTGVPARSLGMS
ncbi:MAG: acetyltransferase [Rhodospirillales bacterium]|nr:acetyltransferase [Rhodospirillales bacterium]